MGREGSWRAPARPPVDHPGPPGRGSSARGASSQRGAIGGAGRAGCGAPRRTATDGRRMKQLWAPWRLAFIEQVSHGSGDRKSVVLGKSVDLGGRRIIKKKKINSTVM